ncbi:MAG: molecular chaperone DnaK, partial [Planctomycetales bacterium]|nr:molecular chaperone DnaK [Planctomycetales bacterium]
RKHRGTVGVHLHARLTEIGTLQLWCSEAEGTRRWRLEFDVRAATQTDIAAHTGAGESCGVVDEAAADAAQLAIAEVFGPGASAKPAGLMKSLGESLGAGRGEWPPSLLRRLWEILIEHESGRRRSQNHEARWLNLLGFALRPGYGVALDDWRVAETWRVLSGKIAHATPVVRTEWWILWRRIAGGFTAGQQRALADPLLAPLRGMHKRMVTGAGGGEFQYGPQESVEIWRLLGSLELLPISTKLELGRILLDLWDKKKMQAVRPALAWTLGRIGARAPLYGPLNVVAPLDAVDDWLARVLKSSAVDANDLFAVMHMARRTGDRYRDINDQRRDQALAWLEDNAAPANYLRLVAEGGALDEEEQGRALGDALPKGLRLA